MDRRLFLKSSGIALAGSRVISIGSPTVLGAALTSRNFQDRVTDRWPSAYVQPLPRGEFEVRHVPSSRIPTQILMRIADRNYDLSVGYGAVRWFYLQNPQDVRFHLENDPILETVWESTRARNAAPSPDGGTMVRWEYGGVADIIFRYNYGGTGERLTTAGDRLPPPVTGLISSVINRDERANGLTAFAHSTDPESWVRGWAAVDRGNGLITYKMQLETDSVRQGPKGKVVVRLYDSGNTELVRTEIEAGMGGKPPGRAVRRDFSAQRTIPVSIAQRVTRVDVTAEHLGGQNGLFGIDFNDVLNAIKLIILVAGG
jgi:hypothetical protein